MKYLLLVIALCTGTLFSCSTGNKLILDGKSEYKIFVSKSAIKPEQNAAAELQKYLLKITGFSMPITHEAVKGEKRIYIGFAGAPESLLKNIEPAGFGKEEYIIRSDGENLLIGGGATRGTMFGVIGYLTDYLNCRWYTRDVIKIPELKTITLSQIEDRQKPALEYREPYYHEAYDTQWALHNRSKSRAIPDSLGGAFITYPFVHTFYQLVQPDKYFAKHPEYFSEVKGVRTRTSTNSQLCLTNPEVVRIATATVFEWIKTHPEAGVFSVDQNDGQGFCECENCRALDEKEGSHAGTLINFVNQIADTVSRVYPDVALQTLAYQYTEVPPKTLRPADNVTIRLCHYNYCSAHPLGKCDSHKEYVSHLEQWGKIAKRITVWDYYTQFASYLMPFPNFEMMKNDVKFYADHGVIGLFAQGNNVPDDGKGEFSELRAWVFSQLMWNPQQDAQKLIDEFVKNVYAEASPYVSEYIRLLHDQVKSDSVYFSIWTEPHDATYLNLKIVKKADSLFTLAKAVSKKDPALFKRVELAYLPVLYTKLYFCSIGSTGYQPVGLSEALADFKRIIAENKITSTAEVPETGSIPKFIERVEFIKMWNPTVVLSQTGGS
jgi:hypothetical protein